VLHRKLPTPRFRCPADWHDAYPVEERCIGSVHDSVRLRFLPGLRYGQLQDVEGIGIVTGHHDRMDKTPALPPVNAQRMAVQLPKVTLRTRTGALVPRPRPRTFVGARYRAEFRLAPDPPDIGHGLVIRGPNFLFRNVVAGRENLQPVMPCRLKPEIVQGIHDG